MSTLLIYTFLCILTLALPLYIYKHSLPIILGGCLAEALCILLIYGSTFISCTESSCATGWAASGIPILFMVMNIGMFWPILAGYAKQAEKDKAKAKAESTKD
jgi:hypothetical protein